MNTTREVSGMKIGIYGGTFNPPHLGHLAAAKTAIEVLGLDRLLLIPAAARACAGLAVLGLRPMDTSQYAAMGASRGGYLAALAVLLVLAAGLPLWLWGSFAPLAAAAGYGLAVWYGYRNLDGMSGDISGFALTLGELCGCAAAILWR